ncbi:MAG TPA: hypothetical protein VMI54_12580 [Polyangiaceae bacterium]|nr:hypothetical protein [Polyangiaceae bacterium]
MANTTHHVKSDLKHRKHQPEQPKARPAEQQTQPERKNPPDKTTRPLPEAEEGFDAPGSQRPPADS